MQRILFMGSLLWLMNGTAHAGQKSSKEVLSLSNGRYVETFDQDSIEQIGQVLYNVNSRQIVGFVTSKDSEAAVSLKPEVISRWLSVDPLAAKYPSISPYAFCANNPIKNLDPDGRKFLDFNQAGQFVGVSHDNFWHNLFHQPQGRVLDGSGNEIQRFKFADTKSDVRDIQNGTINRLVMVNEIQLKTMVAWSGGFDHENKVENRGNDRYGYILRAGAGGGRMDFSYTQIPKMFPEASIDPLNKPSNMIFLPPAINVTEDVVAHNQMNFGNYLFGLSGQAQGFSGVELSAGAHYNSLANPSKNGYSRSWDSIDDQFSIDQGVKFGAQRNWDKIEYKVESGSLQLVEPPTPSRNVIKQNP